MLKIIRLSEIIIYVQDMESQVGFYRDVLNLPIESPTDLGSYKDEFWVVFNSGDCKLALHNGGKKQMGRDAPKFCFEVEDVRASRELLSLKGVKVDEIRSPAPGVEVMDAEDPEGNVFSLETKTVSD